MFFDRIHFEYNPCHRQIYFDIHIPKRIYEKIYFLFQIKSFEFRFEIPQFLIWINKDEFMIFE